MFLPRGQHLWSDMLDMKLAWGQQQERGYKRIQEVRKEDVERDAKDVIAS